MATTPNSDLTVLIFKDNLESKSFKVPMKWIIQMGVIASFFILVFLVSIFLIIKNYTLLSDKKNEVNIVETKKEEIPKITPLEGVKLESKVKVSEEAVESEKSLFSTLSGIHFKNTVMPPDYSPSVSIEKLKTTTNGLNLNIKFDLMYLKKDGKHQRGRIIVLAKTKSGIIGYPKNIFNPIGSENILNPLNGESFFVSRFRQVSANLNPITKNSIEEINIFILNRKNKILIEKNINLQ